MEPWSNGATGQRRSDPKNVIIGFIIFDNINPKLDNLPKLLCVLTNMRYVL